MSLENKMSENWSYKKMSTVKVVHYFYMKINLRKIQMILLIENCLRMSYFGWYVLRLFTKYNNILRVCSILAKNLSNFDPPG